LPTIQSIPSRWSARITCKVGFDRLFRAYSGRLHQQLGGVLYPPVMMGSFQIANQVAGVGERTKHPSIFELDRKSEQLRPGHPAGSSRRSNRREIASLHSSSLGTGQARR
jgi:hypothetical protein